MHLRGERRLQEQQSCLEVEKISFFILVQLSVFVCCVCQYQPRELGFKIMWLLLFQCGDSTFRRLPDLSLNLFFSRNLLPKISDDASIITLLHNPSPPTPPTPTPLICKIFKRPTGLKTWLTRLKTKYQRKFSNDKPKGYSESHSVYPFGATTIVYKFIHFQIKLISRQNFHSTS